MEELSSVSTKGEVFLASIQKDSRPNPWKKNEKSKPFYNLDGDEIEKETTEIKWDAEAAEKAGFEHFMMKEIHEQPKAIQDTLNSVIKEDKIDLSTVEITDEEIQNFDQIYIVASYEDYESFGRSFDRVYAMQPEQLQLGFLKVLKGSDMHEHAQEYGIRYLELPPYEVLYTNWISYGEKARLWLYLF